MNTVGCTASAFGLLPCRKNLVELEMTGEDAAASMVREVILGGMLAVRGVIVRLLHRHCSPHLLRARL